MKASLLAPEPPFATPRPRILEAHGDRRVDPYYWLREKDNPEVIRYLEAENSYADAVMAPTLPLQERLYAEIVGRVQETDTSAPTLYKGWWSYTRTVEGLEYGAQESMHHHSARGDHVHDADPSLGGDGAKNIAAGRSLRRDFSPSALEIARI